MLSSPFIYFDNRSDFFFITKLSLHRGGGLFQHTHLRWISDYCMYLTNLDLQGCTNLSDETLVKIIRNISSTLERLNVSFVFGIHHLCDGKPFFVHV